MPKIIKKKKPLIWLLGCTLLLGGCSQNTAEINDVPKIQIQGFVQTESLELTGKKLYTAVLVHNNADFNFSLDQEADLHGFFESCGFQAEEPFYQSYEETERLQLVLYYDETTGKGVGIKYEYPETGQPVLYGFGFEETIDASHSGGERWNRWKQDYTALPPTEFKEFGISDSQAEYQYDSEGRVIEARTVGDLADWDNPELDYLVSAAYTYDENGTLRHKTLAQNPMIFGTTDCTQDSWFDEQGRLTYERSYITHGSQRFYYIYQDGEPQPTYCLYLDDNLSYWTPEFARLSSPATE